MLLGNYTALDNYILLYYCGCPSPAGIPLGGVVVNVCSSRYHLNSSRYLSPLQCSPCGPSTIRQKFSKALVWRSSVHSRCDFGPIKESSQETPFRRLGSRACLLARLPHPLPPVMSGTQNKCFGLYLFWSVVYWWLRCLSHRWVSSSVSVG